MDTDDDTTEPLPQNQSSQLGRLRELEERLTALEQQFEERGYGTQPMWETLREAIDEVKKELSTVVRDEVIVSVARSRNDRRCIYCRNGIYVEALDSRQLSGNQLVSQLQEWGLNYRPAQPSTDWIIFFCNHCGNLQVFNVANVRNTNAWK